MKATNKNFAGVNVYQMVTDRITEQLNANIIPWRKPWNYAHSNGKNCAINYITRKAYSPLNQMLLGEAGEYLTFKQVTELKGKVKAGAKAKIVVFYKPQQFTKEETTENPDGTKETTLKTYTIPYLQYYRVFHLSDTEGIPTKITDNEVITDIEDCIQEAEEIINNYVKRESANGLKFINDVESDSAYFQPSTDTVVVPMKKQYKNLAEYYSTTFHELTHSTLIASRCNRVAEGAIAAFGSQVYSREELVAEIGSAMLCTVSGIDNSHAFTNSVAYVKGWLKALQNDNKMIIWASARAEKAAKYIQGIKDTENN